ncbi:NB-ARC domain-containing protein [Abeliophyllum distichum]|uniref:NB-ARC domain-containing protein n=1 Tax=Abeliophyllum distichum TaxID=126358 RepID=A0ABD1VCA5_9LAMI
MEALKDKDISIIGICGMPGVGKTTMANEIAHEVKVEKLFDEIVIAVVSQNQDINKIQDQLAEMLGLRIEEKTNNFVRSGRLRERLGGDDGKSILVILDDVWEEIDFETLGIPSPGGQKILKIMFTTRTEDVCSYMRAQRKIEVEVLPKEEAWQLFKDTAGISDHATNVGIAKEVADECGGLPLALVIVAKALKDRNVYVWRDALKQLQNSQVTDQVYSRIELSYNYLKDDEHRSLLLLCSLFAEDESIPIETLVRYSRGLGLFQNTDTLSETRDRAYSIADNLKSCYLLLPRENEEVKLHDLVRDFCLMVASKHKHGYLVKHADLKEWPENDTHESCSAISLTFNELYNLPSGLIYGNLKLLRVLCKLWISSRQNISKEFFKCMKELRVVEFNWMRIQIPSSIQLLTGLRTLCFDCCVLDSEISVIGSLKKLEILTFYYTCLNVDFSSEIAELSNLRSLDLRFKKGPCPLPRGILLGMKKLEELYLGDYFETRDEEQRCIIKEVSSLTCLNTFQISTDDTQFLMQILQALDFEKLERFQITGTQEKGLSTKNNHVTRSLSLLEGIDGSKLSQPVINSVMRRTEHLQIEVVNVVKNLANELDEDGIINLKTLRLSYGGLEYLIDTTKSISTGTFGKLELLELVDLHNLTQICNGSLPRMEHFGRDVSEPQLFCNLKNLYICNCDKIRSMFSETIAKCMVNLQCLYIQNCWMLEEVVSTDTIENEVSHMLGFPKLKEVTLQDLFSFKSFTSQYIRLTLFNQVTLPNLEKLDISIVTSMVKVLYDESNIRSLHRLRQMSVENLDGVSELFNFEGLSDTQNNVENVLGQLRSLELEILPKLVHITRMVPKGICVFQNLTSLVVRNCDSLRYLFSPSMANSLVALETLRVESCDTMEGIIGSEYETSEDGMIEFPNLKDLMLIVKSSFFETLFKQVKLPNLEKLNIGGLDRTVKMLYEGTQIRSLHKLRHMSVEQCDNMSILFDFEGLTVTEDLEESVLGRLEFLQLRELPKLVHIMRMVPKGIRLFQNLTSLQVSECGKLRYLFSPSTANSLVALQSLDVFKCETIEEIIGREGEECTSGSEIEMVEEGMTSGQIEFPKLSSLKLTSLERFRMFCSQNCDLVFPSLVKLLIEDCPGMEEWFLFGPNHKKIQIGPHDFEYTCDSSDDAGKMFLRPNVMEEVRDSRYNVAEICKNRREESLKKKRCEGLQGNQQFAIPVEATTSIDKKVEFENLRAMVDGVWSDDSIRQLDATTKFRKLLSGGRFNVIPKVIQAGVVPRFVAFLMREEFPQLQFEAAWAITNIAFGKSKNVKMLIDHGAVPTFVKLVNSSSDDVREQAVWALGNVAVDSPKYRDLVLGHGALAPLLSQLNERSPVVYAQNCYLDPFQFLQRHPQPAFEQIRPALPILKQLVQYSGDEEAAACAISNATLSGTREQIKYLVSQQCIKPLCDLLVCPDPSIVTVCLRGLENILKVGEAEKHLGHSNLFAQMIDDAQGLEKIKILQSHDDNVISNKALKILQRYWLQEDDEPNLLAY